MKALETYNYVIPLRDSQRLSDQLVSGSCCYRLSQTGDLYKKVRLKSLRAEERAEKVLHEVSEQFLAKQRKKRLMNRIYAMYNTTRTRSYFNFITITFPLEVSNDDRGLIMNTFLTRIRSHFTSFMYVWVREKHKNGKYHYHMFTNNYTNISFIQGMFCETVFNKTGLMPSRSSIDLQVIDPKNHSKCCFYIAKYVGKSDLTGEGRSWACSQLVSRLFCSTISTFDSCESMCDSSFEVKQGDFEITVFRKKSHFRMNINPFLCHVNDKVVAIYENEKANADRHGQSYVDISAMIGINKLIDNEIPF